MNREERANGERNGPVFFKAEFIKYNGRSVYKYRAKIADQDKVVFQRLVEQIMGLEEAAPGDMSEKNCKQEFVFTVFSSDDGKVEKNLLSLSQRDRKNALELINKILDLSEK